MAFDNIPGSALSCAKMSATRSSAMVISYSIKGNCLYISYRPVVIQKGNLVDKNRKP
jgi:hypothetical protein